MITFPFVSDRLVKTQLSMHSFETLGLDLNQNLCGTNQSQSGRSLGEGETKVK